MTEPGFESPTPHSHSNSLGPHLIKSFPSDRKTATTSIKLLYTGNLPLPFKIEFPLPPPPMSHGSFGLRPCPRLCQLRGQGDRVGVPRRLGLVFGSQLMRRNRSISPEMVPGRFGEWLLMEGNQGPCNFGVKRLQLIQGNHLLVKAFSHGLETVCHMGLYFLAFFFCEWYFTAKPTGQGAFRGVTRKRKRKKTNTCAQPDSTSRQCNDGQRKTLSAKKILVACGGLPAEPNIPGVELAILGSHLVLASFLFGTPQPGNQRVGFVCVFFWRGDPETWRRFCRCFFWSVLGSPPAWLWFSSARHPFSLVLVACVCGFGVHV